MSEPLCLRCNGVRSEHPRDDCRQFVWRPNDIREHEAMTELTSDDHASAEEIAQIVTQIKEYARAEDINEMNRSTLEGLKPAGKLKVSGVWDLKYNTIDDLFGHSLKVDDDMKMTVDISSTERIAIKLKVTGVEKELRDV